MFERLCVRNEWKFFAVLPKASGPLAIFWWVAVVLRGVLPAVFAIAMGVLVAAVERGEHLGASLALVGILFLLLQVLTPIHQALAANLGDRTAAWLYDRLTEACVRPPGTCLYPTRTEKTMHSRQRLVLLVPAWIVGDHAGSREQLPQR